MNLNLGENALVSSRGEIFALTPYALSEKKKVGGREFILVLSAAWFYFGNNIWM